LILISLGESLAIKLRRADVEYSNLVFIFDCVTVTLFYAGIVALAVHPWFPKANREFL